MWTGFIFVCTTTILASHCDMTNAYIIFHPPALFNGKGECEERTEHHFQAIEVEGARNARVECDFTSKPSP